MLEVSNLSVRYGAHPALNEVGLTVAESGAGWVVPPGDIPALAQLIRDLGSDPGKVEAAAQAARTWHTENGGRERGTQAWLELVARIQSPQSTGRSPKYQSSR